MGWRGAGSNGSDARVQYGAGGFHKAFARREQTSLEGSVGVWVIGPMILGPFACFFERRIVEGKRTLIVR